MSPDLRVMKMSRFTFWTTALLSLIAAVYVTYRLMEPIRSEYRYIKVLGDITDYLTADPDYLIVDKRNYCVSSSIDSNVVPLSISEVGYEKPPPLWLSQLNSRLPSCLRINQERVHCGIFIIVHAVIFEDDMLRLEEKVNSLNDHQGIYIKIIISLRGLPVPSSSSERMKT